MNYFNLVTEDQLSQLRLPFVTQDLGRYQFWTVPRTGWYEGGKLTGDALGQIYLNWLCHPPKAEEKPSSILAEVVLDMVDFTHMDADREESLRGQIEGFFGHVDRFMAEFAQTAKTPALSAVAMRKLVDQASSGAADSRVTCSELTEQLMRESEGFRKTG